MIMMDIYVRTETKDGVTDFLLSSGYDDFFFIDAKKYAAKHMLLGDEEQVSGRQNYAAFRIYLEERLARVLAENLKKEFTDIKLYALNCDPM